MIDPAGLQEIADLGTKAVAAGAAAAIVIGVGFTAGIIAITSSKLPRQGADVGTYSDYLASRGMAAYCPRCGELVDPEGPGASVECDNCGYEGTAGETDDLDHDEPTFDALAHDTANFLDKMEAKGRHIECTECGEDIPRADFDWDDTECPACGHRGMPLETEDEGE